MKINTTFKKKIKIYIGILQSKSYHILGMVSEAVLTVTTNG